MVNTDFEQIIGGINDLEDDLYTLYGAQPNKSPDDLLDSLFEVELKNRESIQNHQKAILESKKLKE